MVGGVRAVGKRVAWDYEVGFHICIKMACIVTHCCFSAARARSPFGVSA